MEVAIGSLSVSVAVIVGLVEAAKTAGLPTRFAPILSIGLGIAAAFVFPAAAIPVTVFTGIVIGLSASGLYSGTKSVTAREK